jgi:A/G-specific adenine glycosylase
MVRRNNRFPIDRKEIETLPGIGQYIANAILMFCHREPKPLLDVNMARVLERVFGARKLADIRYDPYLQKLAGKIVQCKTSEKLNWAILDIAATICIIRNPRCNDCPIVSICLSADKFGQIELVANKRNEKV